MSDLFWLHIRKSGGTSIAAMMGEAYRRVDRNNFPTCFIASERAEWNDILNNWRIPLGKYTFRRAFFAKTYLYKDDWEGMTRFAAAREPVSRCVSMFHYLLWRRSSLFERFVKMLRVLRWHHRLTLTDRDAFDLFLDLLEIRFSAENNSIFKPVDLHFTTHTARMFDDIADDSGVILLSDVFRLESVEAGVARLLGRPCAQASPRLNETDDARYVPNRDQKLKIENLFAQDFDVYENAIVS